MFDTYQVSPSRVYHDHNTRVVEQRAPTDESVRLLKELTDAARDGLVGIIRNQNNGIDFTAHVFNDPHNPFDLSVRIRCVVNGRSIDFTIQIPACNKPKEMVNIILDKLASEIARNLLVNNIDKLEGVFK